MLRLRYWGFALLAAVGCSPVKDSSNVPDAAIDAMDTRPPMIASSNPANMGTKVSVLQPISVFMDEPLDPASVNAMTVKLGYVPPMTPFVPIFTFFPNPGPVMADGTVPIKGTVSYDASSRKLSFVPASPLPYGAVHVLSLNVKDTAGLALTTKISFTTYVNGQTKLYNFGGANNSPSFWVGTPTDMNGRTAKRVTGSNPGADTIWFTADDPRTSHLEYTMTADARVTDERSFSAGTDGNPDTPDDVLSFCMTYKYDANGLITERTYPTSIGTDNMWCTPDDVPAYNYVFTYMGPTLTGYLWNNEDGVDNTWRTTDDRCTAFYEYEYDTQGLKKREIARNCGVDGLSRTSDDSFAHYYEYEYDATGYVTRFNQRTAAGADTMWLTPDDTMSQLTRHQRDGDGQITETWFSNGAGNDGMFGTVDDTGSRTTVTYNAKKLQDETTTYSIGADNMWNTADDVITAYTKTTYDENGNRLDQKQYGAGPDGMWKNADDRVTIDWDYDTAR